MAATVIFFAPGQSTPTPTAPVAVVPTTIPAVATPPMTMPAQIPVAPAPARIPVAPAPAPARVTRRQVAPRRRVQPQQSAPAPSALQGISFAEYGDTSLDLIARADTVGEATRLSLNFYDMQSKARASERNANSPAASLMWGAASDEFGALASAATNHVYYLQGNMTDSMLANYDNASRSAISSHAQRADSLKPPGM